MAGRTQSYSEVFFQNQTDFPAINGFTSAKSLLTGTTQQPTIPAGFLSDPASVGKTFTIEAAGVVGTNTSTNPYILFSAFLNTTLGPTNTAGASLGVTAQITTGTGVTNKWWFLHLDCTLTVPGLGASNATLSCQGSVRSPSGFVSPFEYPLEVTTPDTATWTTTFDGSVPSYINLCATWQTSHANNTITMKHLKAILWN